MATSPPLKIAVTWCCRLLLGGTFLYAAVSKILDPQGLVTDIGRYRLLPYSLTLALGVYLPWLELACGIAVLIRWRERGALLLLLGLCILFAGALVSAWLRRLDITCGCFGHDSTTSLPWALARIVALGLVTFHLIKQNRRMIV